MKPMAAKGIQFVGHSEMGGHGDGVQIMARAILADPKVGQLFLGGSLVTS